jgi:hypothetical protein
LYQSQLREIAHFVQTQSAGGFLKALIGREQRILMIEGYHKQIGIVAAAFQVCYTLPFKIYIRFQY